MLCKFGDNGVCIEFGADASAIEITKDNRNPQGAARPIFITVSRDHNTSRYTKRAATWQSHVPMVTLIAYCRWDINNFPASAHHMLKGI